MQTQPGPLDALTKHRKVIFDPTINLGHLLTFLGFMAVGSAAYFNLEKRITVQEVVNVGIKAEAEAERGRVRDSLVDLKSDIREIKRGVDQLNRDNK